MRVQKPQVKLFLASAGAIALEQIVPVFHRFVREHALGSELLIDVADYGHVKDGPGVVLIGDASDYYLDLGERRPGLLYSRKRHEPQDPVERLVDALRRTLAACRLLEREESLSPRFAFATSELLLRLNDRLHAENTDACLAELRPALEAALGRLYGPTAFTLAREGSPRDLFTVRVSAPGAPGVATLLDRLGGPPA